VRRFRTTRLLAVLAAAAIAVTACGSGGGSGGGGGGKGSLGAIDLSNASFTVGSKEFTENVVLGQIAVQALKATGAKVGNLVTITGSTNVRTALTAGQIDMYWDYTGTGWTTYLKREVSTAPKDPNQLWQAVADADKANGVVWEKPAPLNNSYALAISEANATKLGVKTMSDYAALVNRDPAQGKLCVAAEFRTRDDGLPGVEKAYGFPEPGVSEVELSLIPALIAAGNDCTVGEVTTSDGSVSANKLQILDDDKQFFVLYNAALNVRQEVADKNPQLAAVFDPISKLLTTESVRKLNERVDQGGELPDDVAASWLKDNGFTA
jgi:osmoprotectant transport system substrate-binding protein